MSDVFISYSRKDKEVVDQIQKSLTRRGIDIWIDQQDISTGTRWDLQIQEGIRASEIILVILSKASVASDNVGNEWSYAKEANKHIIPVLLETCDVPMRLGDLQRIEFLDDFDEGLNKLIVAIRKQLKPEEQAPVEKPGISFPKPLLNFLKYAAPACLVFGIGFYVYYGILLVHLPSIEDVQYKPLLEVSEQLKDKNLSVVLKGEEHADGEAGTVSRTDPEAGSSALRFIDSVDIYVVKKKIKVPNLFGQTRNEAIELLKSLELQAGEITLGYPDSSQDSDALQEGDVYFSEPKPESELKGGDPVTLYVVDKYIEIPDVTGLGSKAAVEKLESQGFPVTIVHAVRDNKLNPHGTIFEMSPAQGKKVKPGSKIEIKLSEKGGWIYTDNGDIGRVFEILGGINLREEPVTGNNKIDTLKRGTLVKVIDKQGKWRKIRVVNNNDV